MYYLEIKEGQKTQILKVPEMSSVKIEKVTLKNKRVN